MTTPFDKLWIYALLVIILTIAISSWVFAYLEWDTVWIYELSFVMGLVSLGFVLKRWFIPKRFLGWSIKDFSFKPWGFLLILLITTGLTLNLAFAAVSFRFFPAITEDNMSTSYMVTTDGSMILLVSIINSVIIAPVFEESVFRGLLLQGLTKRWSFASASMVSSVCFALLHLPSFLDALLFSILMGAVFFRTRKLANCILLHILYNASLVALSYIDNNLLHSYTWLHQLADLYIPLTIIAVAMVMFLVLIIRSNWPSRKTLTKGIPYEDPITT